MNGVRVEETGLGGSGQERRRYLSGLTARSSTIPGVHKVCRYLGCNHCSRAGPDIPFRQRRQLMGYCGAVPSEDSRGKRRGVEASRKPATRTCDESSWKLHGAIVVHPVLLPIAQTKEGFPKRRRRSRGRHNMAAQALYEIGCSRQGSEKSLRQLLVNCWDYLGDWNSSRLWPGNKSQPDHSKDRTFPNKEKVFNR